MSKITREKILKALKGIRNPESGQDIITDGLVSGLNIEGGDVLFMIDVDPAHGPLLESLRLEAERAVSKIKDVQKVTAVLTAERAPKKVQTIDPHGMGKNPRLNLPIKHIVAVASGKGGVGQSTVAANIAVALAKTGLKVGLMDADIYGPSQPMMMGLQGKRPEKAEDGKIIPLIAYGVKVMSIGLMLDSESPLIWRGPMVQTAIYQLLRDVHWASHDDPMDILVVDMPPGTGDAQLTMAQKVPLSGAVIVSTPQDIALIDARKAVSMFGKVSVNILGLIENMSYHKCSSCGHKEDIFGRGGARREADRLGIPFLGEIPLHSEIRTQSDKGRPPAASIEDGSHGVIFKKIADKIMQNLIRATRSAA